MITLTLFNLIAAALVPIVLGYLWFHPKLFGTYWLWHSGMTPEQVERGKRHRHFHALIALALSFISSSIIYSVGSFFFIENIFRAAFFGVMLWLGIAVPVLSGIVLWEQKPFKLFLINSTYWLVTLVVMSLIIFY